MRFDIDLFQKITNQARTSEVVLSELKEKDFTHLLVGQALFAKWVYMNFDEPQKKLVREFFKKDARSIFSKGGYELFEL